MLRIIIFCCFINFAYSEDERFFRELFSGELNSSNLLLKNEEKKYKYIFHTPFYSVDLNEDNKPEFIVFVKRDSDDFLEIYKQGDGQKILAHKLKLDVYGRESKVFKIAFKKLNDEIKVLIVYYFEGFSKYIKTQSSARVYFITFKNNLEFKDFKGPAFFEEFLNQKGNFHLKNYSMNLEDLNKDGTKEFILKFNNYSRIYFFEKDGEWRTYN